jgi:hypothetical protein
MIRRLAEGGVSWSEERPRRELLQLSQHPRGRIFRQVGNPLEELLDVLAH